MNDRNTGTNTMDQARDTANRAADQARDTVSRAADQARDLGNRAVDQAKNLGREAVEQGSRPQTQPKEEHREGTVARTIEQQTAKLPSDAFLWAAFGAIGASMLLQISGKDEKANFVGQWAPTLLILGLYNKMVKLMGSDAR